MGKIIYFPGCEPNETGTDAVSSDVVSIEASPFDVSLNIPACDGTLVSKLKTIIMNMFIHIMFCPQDECEGMADEAVNKLMSSYESPDDMALDLCGVTAKELLESAGIAIK